MEWYYVWWPWLTSKRVARFCQHQLSFLLALYRRAYNFTYPLHYWSKKGFSWKYAYANERHIKLLRSCCATQNHLRGCIDGKNRNETTYVMEVLLVSGWSIWTTLIQWSLTVDGQMRYNEQLSPTLQNSTQYRLRTRNDLCYMRQSVICS